MKKIRKKNKGAPQCYLFLENIRSVENVGAIFRTANAAGVFKIYCGGYTPTPLDRFGNIRQDFAKASLGADRFVAWESAPLMLQTLSALKKKGLEIVCLEQDNRARDYKAYHPRKDFVLIVGNEVNGIERKTLAKADHILEIEMAGEKKSLNVATALGISLFRILNR